MILLPRHAEVKQATPSIGHETTASDIGTAGRKPDSLATSVGIMGMNDYPRTVAEVMDPSRKFKPAVFRAVRAFARSRPWWGSLDERREKFRQLHLALAAAYSRVPAKLVFGGDESEDSGQSCYIPDLDTIVLRGRLSVISYLHEARHWIAGPNEHAAVGWSAELFRRAFPQSFARLRFEGHMCRSTRTPRQATDDLLAKTHSLTVTSGAKLRT